MIEFDNYLAQARPVVFAANTPRYLLRHLTDLSGVQDLSTCYTTHQLLDELLSRLNADCDLDVLTEVYVILAALSMTEDLNAGHLQLAMEHSGSIRWVRQIVEMIATKDLSTTHIAMKHDYRTLLSNTHQSAMLVHDSVSQIQFLSTSGEELRDD